MKCTSVQFSSLVSHAGIAARGGFNGLRHCRRPSYKCSRVSVFGVSLGVGASETLLLLLLRLLLVVVIKRRKLSPIFQKGVWGLEAARVS